MSESSTVPERFDARADPTPEERSAVPDSTSAPPTPVPPELEQKLRIIRSEDILQGEREVLILHAGRLYRLVRTRFNKLVLQR